MSYRKALERLLTHEPKSLIRMSYWDGAYCCVIGAVCPETRVGCNGEHIIDLGVERKRVREALRECGLGEIEAWRLQRANDRFDGTDEARYAHILTWLEVEVAKEAAQ